MVEGATRKLGTIALMTLLTFACHNVMAAQETTRGLTLTVSEDGVDKTIPLYQRSFALVIGNDHYEQPAWVSLSNAIKDAREVGKALEAHGFEVTLATDLNSRALESTVEEFVIYKGRYPNARLLIWYAGHGHTIDGEGYLVPTDAPDPDLEDGVDFRFKALSLRRFGEFMREARARHVIAVFDSCFSGTVFTSARSKPPAAVTRAVTNKVRQFVSSGDANQAVSDDGLFRKLFLDAINGKDMRADMNGDGYILGSELGLYLDQRVSNLTGNSQTPRFGKLRAHGFDLGDFVFKIPEAIEPGQSERDSGQPASPTANPDNSQELLDRIARLEKLLQMQQQQGEQAKIPSQQTQPNPQSSEPDDTPMQSIGGKEGDELPATTSGTAINTDANQPSSTELGRRIEVFLATKEKYSKGEISKEEMIKASLFLNEAAMSGEADAQQELGVCYWDASCGFEKNAKKAVRLIRMAADNGNAQAQSDIGWMYFNGKGGLPVDFKQSAHWYEKAAEQGIASAQNELGFIYQYGKGGIRVDEREAVRLYRLAAEQQEPNALNNLAYMYNFGKGGLPQDKEEAVRYYRRAAELGHTIAQWELANFYFNGTGGLPEDQEEAARLYRLAAEKGDAMAQNDLGYMYRKGLGGLPFDPDEAERLYKLAAEQNEPTAMYNLGHLYEFGTASKRDPVAAAKYFMMAFKQGEKRTTELLIEKRGRQLSAPTRQQIQEILQAEGYYSGRIDANFGGGTRSALLNYRDRG